MDDPTEVGKEIITGAVAKTAEKVLASDVVKALLLPAANELGSLAGEIAGAARFYASACMGNIFKKWHSYRNGKAVTEAEFLRVLPLLPAASLVNDENLQKLWAQLLESFAGGSDMTLPSFGQTLSQLTPLEANFLERVWAIRMFPQRTDGLRRLYYQCRQKDFDEYALDAEIPLGERIAVRIDFDVILSDIMRLGILDRNGTFSEQVDDEIEENIAFTGYGRRFMRCVLGQLGPEGDD